MVQLNCIKDGCPFISQDLPFAQAKSILRMHLNHEHPIPSPSPALEESTNMSPEVICDGETEFKKEEDTDKVEEDSTEIKNQLLADLNLPEGCSEEDDEGSSSEENKPDNMLVEEKEQDQKEVVKSFPPLKMKIKLGKDKSGTITQYKINEKASDPDDAFYGFEESEICDWVSDNFSDYDLKTTFEIKPTVYVSISSKEQLEPESKVAVRKLNLVIEQWIN